MRVGPPSPGAKLCHAHPVEMHNVFEISAASTESVIFSASLLEKILHFYRLQNPRHGRGGWLEVTEFSTRGDESVSPRKELGKPRLELR